MRPAQESADGQRAVAQVVLNRVRHPAFPNSVCGVVYEGSTRADRLPVHLHLRRLDDPRADPRAMEPRPQGRRAKCSAGGVYAPVGYATHYHANYVVPYWASSLTKTNVEGAHIFYRWPGGWGRPAAFTDRWSGREANPAALRLAALSAPHVSQAGPDRQRHGREAGGKPAPRSIEGKDGRVRVLFTPQAREAVEKVKVMPYVERSAASDNLRFALDGGDSGGRTAAFGRINRDARPAETQSAQSALGGSSRSTNYEKWRE